MTIREIKERYKDYKLRAGETNAFVSHDYGDGNGKIVIIVNMCKGYGKTVMQAVRVSDGAKMIEEGRCRPCDSLSDAIDVADEMMNNK